MYDTDGRQAVRPQQKFRLAVGNLRDRRLIPRDGHARQAARASTGMMHSDPKLVINDNLLRTRHNRKRKDSPQAQPFDTC